MSPTDEHSHQSALPACRPVPAPLPCAAAHADADATADPAGYVLVSSRTREALLRRAGSGVLPAELILRRLRHARASPPASGGLDGPVSGGLAVTAILDDRTGPPAADRGRTPGHGLWSRSHHDGIDRQ